MDQNATTKSFDEEKYGAKPFDAQSPGDCVLKSSDGMKFKVYRTVLCLASPIFSDMFDMPQGGEVASELPVVDVSEGSKALYTFLLLLYPSTRPVIDNYDVASEVARAHDKYLVDTHRLRLVLRENLLSDDACLQNAFKVYCLSWKLGLKNETLNASRYLHDLSLKNKAIANQILQCSGDLEALTALWDLRLRREIALDLLIKNLALDTYRCPAHNGLTADELMELRTQLRHVMSLANPTYETVHNRLDIRRVFKELPNAGVAPPPINPYGSLPARAIVSSRGGLNPCHECKTLLKTWTADVAKQRMAELAEGIRNYPQTIIWPSGKDQ